jgi:hypothetical protein
MTAMRNGYFSCSKMTQGRNEKCCCCRRDGWLGHEGGEGRGGGSERMSIPKSDLGGNITLREKNIPATTQPFPGGDRELIEIVGSMRTSFDTSLW